MMIFVDFWPDRVALNNFILAATPWGCESFN